MVFDLQICEWKNIWINTSHRYPSGPSFRISIIGYTEPVRWVSLNLCVVFGCISQRIWLEWKCSLTDSMFIKFKWFAIEKMVSAMIILSSG